MQVEINTFCKKVLKSHKENKPEGTKVQAAERIKVEAKFLCNVGLPVVKLTSLLLTCPMREGDSVREQERKKLIDKEMGGRLFKAEKIYRQGLVDIGYYANNDQPPAGIAPEPVTPAETTNQVQDNEKSNKKKDKVRSAEEVVYDSQGDVVGSVDEARIRLGIEDETKPKLVRFRNPVKHKRDVEHEETITKVLVEKMNLPDVHVKVTYTRKMADPVEGQPPPAPENFEVEMAVHLDELAAMAKAEAKKPTDVYRDMPTEEHVKILDLDPILIWHPYVVRNVQGILDDITVQTAHNLELHPSNPHQ